VLRGIFVVALLSVVAVACDKGNVPAVISQEDRELLAKIKAKEKAKADLVADPSRYVDAGTWDLMDRGFFNSYSRATAVQMKNNSQFDISDIQGKLTYLNGKGEEMATVPFRAEGDLRAGEAKKLKVAAGEITGAAKRARITVESVRVLGS
jgi:hypothetical protein